MATHESFSRSTAFAEYNNQPPRELLEVKTAASDSQEDLDALLAGLDHATRRLIEAEIAHAYMEESHRDTNAALISANEEYVVCRSAYQIAEQHHGRLADLETYLSGITEADQRWRRYMQRTHLSPRRARFHRGKKAEVTE